MRFIQSAVLALALVGSIVGVSAKKHHDKKHHDVLHSKQQITKQQITENMAHDMFTAFMKQYSKKYTHEEFSSRFQTFKANLEKIRAHNTMVNSTFTMGLNEFADLTFAEFKAKYFGYKKINREFDRAKNYAKFDPTEAVEASVDWRNSNVLTPVKNQGQCGSCWAFSTTGSVEAAYNIKNQPATPVDLSEQQLVDCSTSYGNNGCNGGLMDNAFKYIIANGGLCSESAYAYTGAQGTCNTSCENVVTISSYVDVTPNSATALQQQIAKGPVSIAIEADQASFQFYSSGEITSGCGTALDHGVLAVGYNTDASGNLYWIVKNSWGSSWGQAGYVYIQDGQCGVKVEPSRPIA